MDPANQDITVWVARWTSQQRGDMQYTKGAFSASSKYYAAGLSIPTGIYLCIIVIYWMLFL